MAIADYYPLVQKFYVAYFGRPADSGALQNMARQLDLAGAPVTTQEFASAYETNATVKATIDSFGNSAESAALYTGDTASFVTAIFNNVLGRAPRPEGLAFWTAAISSGSLPRGKAALDIMAGAEANLTEQGRIDATLIANRIVIASSFTAAIDTTDEINAYSGSAAAASARSMLNAVTATTNVASYESNATSTLASLVTVLPTLDLAANDDTGSSGTDNITRNAAGLTIEGTAETGATVKLFDTDGTTELGTTTGANGRFSLDLALAEGTHDITAKITDGAGHRISSKVLSLTIDTSAPETPVAWVFMDRLASLNGTTRPALAMSGIEAGATVEYSQDGTTWSTNFAMVSGNNTVQVRQTDVAGNVSGASPAVSFVLDRTAPMLTSSTPTDYATGVAIASNLVLRFDETVMAGIGNIVISDGDSDIRTIPIDDTSQISISGNTVTINPTLDLLNGKHYSVLIASGVIMDEAGNAFAGITDPGLLNLTTVVDDDSGVIRLSTLNDANGFRLDGERASEVLSFPGGGTTTRSGDNSGRSVSSAGDVNGDGFDDVMISAPYVAYGGAVYIVFGRASGLSTSTSLASLDGTNGFRLNPAGTDDSTGTSISAAGDINGDGFDDMIIGADGAAPFGTRTGSAFVVFGKASGFSSEIDLSSLNGTNGFRVNGAISLGYLGRSVGSAGDVNGDGFDDILVGAYGPGVNIIAGDDTPKEHGTSYVIFGKASGFAPTISVSSLNGSNGFSLSGVADVDLAGASVSSAGDVNADGYSDMIIGANGADPNGSYSGSSYVVFGKASGFGSNINLSSLNGSNGFRLDGATAEDSSGFVVRSAGDVNGDGFSDLLIGASQADPHGAGSGSSYVVFGKASGFSSQISLSSLNGSNGFRLDGAAENDGAGFSLSAAGDVNGDGFDDVVVGAHASDPNGANSGTSYVVFGKASGFASSINLSTLGNSDGFRIEGGTADDLAGISVSSAGDVNGDGFGDLIVGASGANQTAGASYVIFGSNLTGAVNFLGTSGADAISGTSTAERFVAGNGNDAITGGGGADVLYGGAGDDILIVPDLGFQRIDGGSGSDTLRLSGSSTSLNLASFRNKIHGIETIDLTGTANNILALTARDLINLSDSDNRLRVDGNADDLVSIGSGWTDSGLASGYHTYTQGQAILLVGSAITVIM